MNAQEQLLTARLTSFQAPGEVEAGERGRRLVLAAFLERTPVRHRRLHLPRLVWPVLAALLAASAVAVAGYLRDGGSPRSARAPFGAEVEDGVVLALGRGVASTVDAHGRIRLLGPASDGDLSPHARNAVLASGSFLVAVNVEDGQVRWRIRAPGPVSLPRWSLERSVPPCCRVTYLSAGALYAVGGDGKGTHIVARRALAVAPAWRPAVADHELAYAAPDGVHVVEADSGRPRARLPGRSAPIALSWRADGRVLAVLDRTGATLYSAGGERVGRLSAHGSVLAGGFALRGNRLVVLRRDAGGRAAVLVRGVHGPLRAIRHLPLAAAGDFRLSPDGRSALVGSREGDEWLEIRLRDGELRHLREIGRRLRAGFSPRVLAWAG